MLPMTLFLDPIKIEIPMNLFKDNLDAVLIKPTNGLVCAYLFYLPTNAVDLINGHNFHVFLYLGTL